MIFFFHRIIAPWNILVLIQGNAVDTASCFNATLLNRKQPKKPFMLVLTFLGFDVSVLSASSLCSLNVVAVTWFFYFIFY